MRLDDLNESGNVDDSRGSKKAMAAGGGILAVVIGLVAAYFGIDPRVAQQLGNQVAGPQQQVNSPAPNDGMGSFSRKVLKSTEDVWSEQFNKNGFGTYEFPKMELFSERVDSGGCGVAPSSVGPFYCPASRKVFLDPTFFDELESKLGGSKADFSKAYVIAHEVGHHVQNLLRYNARLEEPKYKREGDNSGIRLELQADYLAGVWAYHADKKFRILEKGDVDSAIKTALSIGDDRLQKRARGWVSPEKFNHGTSAQRKKHFLRGLETGDASKPTLDKFFDVNIKPLAL